MRNPKARTISFGVSRLAPAFAILLLVTTATYVLVSAGARPAPVEAIQEATVQATSTLAPGATASAIEATALSTDRIVQARRGTLREVLTLNGRLGAEAETPLSFQSAQRLSAVRVSPGDKVSAGQVLAEADQRELARSLAAARDRYATAKSKLDQAEAQLATKVRNAEQRQSAARARADRAVADAQTGVRRAEANLDRVQAGAAPAERRSAEIAVTTARAALSRAESDLTRLQQGPADLELRQAEQQVAVAQGAYQKAVAEYEKLATGPDPAQVRLAEREVLAAQNAVLRAQMDLEKVAQPDPVALAAAQREVQRAETALRLAQQSDKGSNSSDKSSSARPSQAERRAAIDNAKLTLQDAIDRYERLRAGPPPGEVTVAQRNLVNARSTLEAARERLDIVKQGADSTSIEQAKVAADSAKLVYESAASQLKALRAGTPADQLNAAITGYESARVTLRSALAMQSELLARPTQEELREAIELVSAAKLTLEQASAEAQVSPDAPLGEATGEVEPLRQSVEQEQAAVRALEADLLHAQIVAPFDGIVVSVAGRPEQGIDASRAVLTLAAADAVPVVIADVPTITGARLSVGQQATVKYGGQTSGEVNGTVDDVSDLGSGQVRVRLKPSWMSAPGFGAPASVDVVTRERADVVIVPERALVGAGSRRTLQIIEGETRRTVQVDVGLISGGEAEILNGIEPEVRIVIT